MSLSLILMFAVVELGWWAFKRNIEEEVNDAIDERMKDEDGA